MTLDVQIWPLKCNNRLVTSTISGIAFKVRCYNNFTTLTMYTL